MSERCVSESDQGAVREDGTWTERAGRGQRHGACLANSTGGVFRQQLLPVTTKEAEHGTVRSVSL